MTVLAERESKPQICNNYTTLEPWQMLQIFHKQIYIYSTLLCCAVEMTDCIVVDRFAQLFCCLVRSEFQLRIKAKSLSGEPSNRKVNCKMCWHFLFQPWESWLTANCNWVRAVKLQSRHTADQCDCVCVHVSHAYCTSWERGYSMHLVEFSVSLWALLIYEACVYPGRLGAVCATSVSRYVCLCAQLIGF